MRRFLAVFMTALTMNAAADEWQSLFNGKDLTGWTGDPRLWSVQDGVLTGETDGEGRKIDENSFLISQAGEPADFELEFKARVSGDNNSGVQYRSKVVDPAKWSVGGYQMDLHPNQNYVGMLYEERGRGIACERGQQVNLGEKPEVTGSLEKPEVKLSDWNDYRIVAKGSDLQHFINGKLAAEIHDQDEGRRALKGILALQLHAGPAMKAEFKDVRLKPLEATPPKPPAPKGEPVTQWIWFSEEHPPGERVFFRREFHLPPDVASASITIACDDAYTLYLNGGDPVGSGDEWRKATTFDVLGKLKDGAKNILAVEGRNVSGYAGMALRFRATLKDGRVFYLITDGKWFCSHEGQDGWQNLEFSAPNWQPAFSVRKMGEEPWGQTIKPEGQ
ncbi:MAG: Cytochrome c [Akkermansiaceae bacterium]|nr:Cytochrome c [Akkermansiaceae bacterium]